VIARGSEFWISCRRFKLGGFEIEKEGIAVIELRVDNGGSNGDSLVDPSPFVRRVVDSNPTLAAT